MQTISYFVRRYPAQTAATVGCLALASISELLGFSVILPLLSLAHGGAGSGHQPQLERFAREALSSVGLRPTIGNLLVVMTSLFTAKAALVLIAKKRVGYTVAQTATDLRLDLLRALLATRWVSYTRLPLGRLANAMSSEANRASQAYLYLAQMWSLVLETAVYLAVALATSLRGTLVALLGGAISWLLLTTFVGMAARAGRRQTQVLKSLLTRLNDTFQAIKLLRSMGRETLVGPLLERDTRRLHRELKRRVFSQEALLALQEPILILLVSSYVYVALVHWKMQIAPLMLLVYVFAQAIRSVNKVQRKYQSMVTEERALWSIRELIDGALASPEPRGGSRIPALEHGIEVEEVSVAFDDRTVLDGLTLSIPRGRITALVGESGAGKSTLLDLLTGLLEPTAGEIRVDGVPLRQLDIDRWRHRIGYVPQEVLIFHDSVRMNVTLGDPAVSDADVERALRQADAWEFVARLEEGLDASMGERGLVFSGGQRQRIAIARALVRRPDLLILDEATASLDKESEREIWETLGRLRGETTIVAISHQSELTRLADRVYRIAGGRAEGCESARESTEQPDSVRPEGTRATISRR